jgi:hypothetical protein
MEIFLRGNQNFVYAIGSVQLRGDVRMTRIDYRMRGYHILDRQ